MVICLFREMNVVNQLLVFAHRDEASAFADVPHLVTGVGKIHAATQLSLELSRAAAQGAPITEVLVLGTAGIIGEGHDLNTVVQITEAVQHDYSLPSPKLSCAATVDLDETAVIATGDQFVQDDVQRAKIAQLGATLVDMEVYAYAATCAAFEVPLRVFKIPSDFANSDTTGAQWDEIVFLKSTQLREFYNLFTT